MIENTEPNTGSSKRHDVDPTGEILKTSRVIAVVGLSGYRIIPVNPRETEILGEKCVARLEDIREEVDIVDIFRRSEFVPEIMASAIAIGARAVWMQEGVIHAEAAEQGRRAGMFVVMDSCILKEHVKRFRLPAD